MRLRARFRLAERYCRLRRMLAALAGHDPKPWVVALAAVAMGLGIFVVMLAWVGTLRLLAYVAKLLR